MQRRRDSVRKRRICHFRQIATIARCRASSSSFRLRLAVVSDLVNELLLDVGSIPPPSPQTDDCPKSVKEAFSDEGRRKDRCSPPECVVLYISHQRRLIRFLIPESSWTCK